MRILVLLLLALFALLAFFNAATAHGAFFTLGNTEFVVLLSFLVFAGILLYFRVPGRISTMLDHRADTIRNELAEARSLREEAQTLLASFDRKRQEVSEQSARIVADARAEAERAAALAKDDAVRAVQRRIAAAEEQLAAAEAKAIRDVKDRAVAVAVAAAQEVLATQMTPEHAARMADDSIAAVGAKLH